MKYIKIYESLEKVWYINEKIEVPDDFEVWSNAKKYNL